mmetsp:Transcript_23622/g.52751  ORF Transcript_23622/g.52751 Transcript_23622/m.52751 type:complete len:328 (-) Transcript_23622:1361-2344(-)
MSIHLFAVINFIALALQASAFSTNPARCPMTTTKLHVRNVDFLEALVFYGEETLYDPAAAERDDGSATLRPGIARILLECKDIGTAALVLSENESYDEATAKEKFASAVRKSDHVGIAGGDLVHIRCTDFECHDSDEFYNLKSAGLAPSPAFLLDALRSVSIEPRGFGGSSGFGRGQWVEPRRNPMQARTVVFVAGDWRRNSSQPSTVAERCAAARAAGTRVIYLSCDSVLNNEETMSLCDCVVNSYGNDDQGVHPISLDSISTPGDYWLNPPLPRDGEGNGVSVDELVDALRKKRETKGDESRGSTYIVDDAMSEDDIEAILADLN